MTSRPSRLSRNLQRMLDDGLRQHQAGEIAAAGVCYRTVLESDPLHADALHLLGIAERDAGRPEDALRHLQRVVQLRPHFAEAQGNLGLVLAELGRHCEAVVAYQRALALNSMLAEPWYNLANSVRDSGDLEAAVPYYEEALKRRPFVAGWRNYALVLTDLRRYVDAVNAYRAALAMAPNDADLCDTMGAILQRQGAMDEAITWHYRATQLRPDFAEAHSNLGNALKEYGRPVEAIASYRAALAINSGLVPAWNNLGSACLKLGQLDQAMMAFRQALQIAPEFADAELNLGNVLKLRGHLAEATFCFNHALSVKPDFVQAHNNLGVVLSEQGQHAEAEAHLRQALELEPKFAEAHNNLGNLYKNQGRLEAALACFRRALDLRPDYAGAHSNLLFTLNFMDGVAPGEIFAQHREFNARHARSLSRAIKPHQNTREPARRLRVGYVSPDFRAHACAFFVEPIFCHHRRAAIEVFAYAEVAHPDAVTRRLQGLADGWRSTVGLGDEQVAAMIRADGIDVLVDLAGHTANGRLLAFAHKPAPVQVTYLGYPTTTGLDVMDYRITDAITEPPGRSERFYTETLYRLPHSLWCYQPFADMPAVSRLPALTRGAVTFGSFNNYAKIGPRVIQLWAQVLRTVSDSRLIMITVPQGAAQTELHAQFSALGIAAERVVLHDRLLRQEYLALFSAIDIALDPFPCNGGTTTCDALWMGVPVVSQIGETFLSRASYSLLAASGMTAFAARDHAHYVRICHDHASNLTGLSRLRSALRARLSASPLLDAEGFTQDLENAYREMWLRWCQGSAPKSVP